MFIFQITVESAAPAETQDAKLGEKKTIFTELTGEILLSGCNKNLLAF